MIDDYSASLIAARIALREAEEAINRGDFMAATHRFEAAALDVVKCEIWSDAKLRPGVTPMTPVDKGQQP